MGQTNYSNGSPIERGRPKNMKDKHEDSYKG